MNKITWIDPYLDLVLNEIPVDTKTILEVGCGSGIFGFILKKTRDAKIVGVEPFAYELDHYDFIYQMTWKKFFKMNQAFDVLVCNETVEHMEKKDALDFLDEAKTVADKVIITTPHKFDQQPAYDDNPFQVHQCMISKEEFEKNEYGVKQIGFNIKNGIRMYSESTMYSKLLQINPTNLIAIYNKNLLNKMEMKN